MKCIFRSLIILALLFFWLSLTLIAQDNAQQEVNLGAQAYKKGKLDEASEHFEKSLALAPENTFAHFYLATTYANL